MSKRVFDKIADGLTEALAVARGEAEPAKLHIPSVIDVKAIRAQLGLSQNAFAASFGFTASQIRDWEQSRFQPVGANRAYLTVIARNPRVVLSTLREEMDA